MPRSVLIDIIGRDNASRAFESSAASAERAAKRMGAVSAGMSRAGAAMTKSITVPVVAVAAVAVKQAADFQKSMTLLQTAGGELQKNMATVSNGIKQIAVQTGTSLADLSEGMYTVEKAGIRGKNGLLVLKAAAEGAKAENVDLGTATNALTSVMMSYHLHAQDAVKVQNMLVAGAGMAKTTMQSYAGALSTVIPVASAAGISFAQVAGAIATLTQHGTSADEATQELSHTIRNLLKPNQVAQKAMQQLGLSVTDVSSNLGKRGLTGTIDLITTAITKHMGPAGLVVVDAFKKSQSATAALQTMLSKMPKSLNALSAGLLSGKTTIKDYTKASKDLGGEAGAMGLQFLSAYKTSLGFNDLLKSGQPQARTFAGTLAQVLGTATSMNTALQLGGENLGYFEKATASVGAAGLKTGADISTWAKTQATLAVQADKAKEKLQVMAVNIGEKLIPIVAKLVGWVSKAVDWFTNLSPATQDFIEKAALFAAALGPVLSILGRVGMLISGVIRLGSGIGSMIGTVRTMGTAARGAMSAMSGLDLGLVVGAMTRNSSTGVKLMSSLGAAGAGAAIGFSMGGPWGAAIGGVMGGLGSLATQFIGTGHSADLAAQQMAANLAAQQQAASDLLTTLESVNGAYNDQYKLAIIQKLQQNLPGDTRNAFDYAQLGGFSAPSVTAATLGDPKAIAQLNALIAKFNNSNNNADIAKGGFLTAVLQAITRLSPAARLAEQRWEQLNAAQGKTVVSSKLLAGGLRNLAAELAGTGTSLSTNTAEGERNNEVLKENVASLNKSATYQLLHGRTVQQVTQWLNGQSGALKFTTTNLGFQATAVQGVIDKYKLTPRQIITYMLANAAPGVATVKNFQGIIDAIRQNKIPGVTAKTDEANYLIGLLQAKIDGMHGKTLTVTVTEVTQQQLGSTYRSQVPGSPSAHAAPPLLLPGNAAGGSVRDGWFTAGERGWELGHKRGNKVDFFSNRDSQKMTGWRSVPGYATGTTNAQRLNTTISDVYTLRGAAISTSASELAAAFHTLLTDLGSAVSHKVIDNLTASEKKLASVQVQRTSVTNQLSAAESHLSSLQSAASSTRSGVMSGFTGAFDITTAGQVFNDQPATASSILAAVTTVAGNARAYATVLASLQRKGLGMHLLAQLAAAGPGALAQAKALDAATPAQLAGINSGYFSLETSGAAAGVLAANSLYGAGISAANGLIDQLKKRSGDLAAAVSSLVASMLSALHVSLGGAPHHAAGGVTLAPHLAWVGDNRSRNELIAPLDSPAARRLIGEAAGNGRHGAGGLHYHFHGLEDPDAIMLAVDRRRNRAGAY